MDYKKIEKVFKLVKEEMNTDEYKEQSKKIKEMCEKIEEMPFNTKEDIQKAKELSREIPSSAEKVLLFRFLIMKEKELTENRI